MSKIKKIRLIFRNFRPPGEVETNVRFSLTHPAPPFVRVRFYRTLPPPSLFANGFAGQTLSVNGTKFAPTFADRDQTCPKLPQFFKRGKFSRGRDPLSDVEGLFERRHLTRQFPLPLSCLGEAARQHGET